MYSNVMCQSRKETGSLITRFFHLAEQRELTIRDRYIFDPLPCDFRKLRVNLNADIPAALQMGGQRE